MQRNHKVLFLLLSFFIFTSLNAKVIEVEQLFNKKTVKVKEQKISVSKSFYGKMAIDESKVVDVVTRFDGFITKLNANKTFMYVKKDEALFRVYSDEILSIQKELQVSKSLNNALYRRSVEK